MPNYRYNSSDYMRRGNCNRTAAPLTSRPSDTSCGNCQPTPPTPPCKPSDPLSQFPIAMAYVPWQDWKNIYEIENGFQYGTIFCELNKPFTGRGGCVK